MELFWQILYYAFTALYVYIAIVVLTAIVSENRNPVKTLGWIMIMILLPVVGITLPFLSAGGSSVVSTYIAIGVALSVYRQNHIKTMY